MINLPSVSFLGSVGVCSGEGNSSAPLLRSSASFCSSEALDFLLFCFVSNYNACQYDMLLYRSLQDHINQLLNGYEICGYNMERRNTLEYIGDTRQVCCVFQTAVIVVSID